MHQAFNHLSKRVGEAIEAVEAVLREVEAQSERETKHLERVAYGDDDDFDQGVAPVQEQVVAALQDAMEQLDQAATQLAAARERLDDIQSF